MKDCNHCDRLRADLIKAFETKDLVAENRGWDLLEFHQLVKHRAWVLESWYASEPFMNTLAGETCEGFAERICQELKTKLNM
jgi:hypothetical protein